MIQHVQLQIAKTSENSETPTNKYKKKSDKGLKLKLKKTTTKKPKKKEKLNEIEIKTENPDIEEDYVVYDDTDFDPNFDIKQEMYQKKCCSASSPVSEINTLNRY